MINDDQLVGLKEESFYSSIQLFPVSADDVLHLIYSNDLQVSQTEMIDAYGKSIYINTKTVTVINTSEIESGIYFIN